MPDDSLVAFERTLSSIRRQLQTFAEFYSDVRYTYYRVEPAGTAPRKVWQYVCNQYTHLYEELDFGFDDAVCIAWDEESFSTTKFRAMCCHCWSQLREHNDVLKTVDEAAPLLEHATGHHPWIHLMHSVARCNPLVSGAINRWLVMSSRPFEDTKAARTVAWDDGTDLEPEKVEEELVRELRTDGEEVPDVYAEYIPTERPVVLVYVRIVDGLEALARDSRGEERIARLKPLEKKMILALAEDTLTTSKLCDRLTTLTGKIVSESGHTKGTLSTLVDSGFLENRNDGSGYFLTRLGRRAYRQLKACGGIEAVQ